MNDQPPNEAAQPRQTEEQQMACFDITAEQKTVYRYQGHVYEHLSDALAYASIDRKRLDAPAATPGRGE